ncbi:MAG: tetratricopeptide repeat protein [Chitinophagaceae bacterium]|nr:tetratricopeptide repeat protein [Chitinophagaceae bacterium]
MKAEINNNKDQSRIEKLKYFLESSPNDCFLWHALGLEYLKIEQKTDAISCFEKVLQIDENYVGTYYHLAAAKIQLNLQEAILIYKKGIEIATKLKDNHAKNELQMMLDEINDED